MSRSRRIVQEDNEVLDDSQLESVEAPMLEMNEISNELESVQEDIDEASDTMETAEDLSDGLDNVIEEGGLTEGAAEVLNTSIEHMRSRMGFSKRSKFMPSMENFGTKSSRIQATRIVQEGLIDMAKKLWKSIVSLFNRAVQWVKDFYKKNFTAVGRIKERVKSMLMKLEGMTNLDKAGKVDYESAANILFKGKSLLSTPKEIEDAMNSKEMKETNYTVSNFLSIIDDVFDTGIDKLNSVSVSSASLRETDVKGYKDNKKEHLDATLRDSTDFLKTLQNFKPSVNAAKPPKDYEIPDGCRLFGGPTGIADLGIYVVLPNHDIQGWDYLALLGRSKGFIQTIANGEEEGPGNTTANCWKVEDIVSTLTALQVSLNAMEDEANSKVVKFIDSGLAKAEKLANRNPKNNEEDKAMRKLAPMARVILQLTTTFNVQKISLATKVAHAICDVSQRCMHIHSGKTN